MHIFPKGIRPKVNIAWLEFELSYFEVAVQSFGYYVKDTPLITVTHYHLEAGVQSRDQVVAKTKKMLYDAALLNIQHYMVRI